MSVLWPELLLFLLVIPVVLVTYVVAQRRRRPIGARYSSLSLVREAGPSSSRIRRHLPFALFLIALGALVIALSRPIAIVPVVTNQRTIVLALDVSGSMCSSDIPPSRLQAAEAAAAEFIQREGADSQIGIVAFSGFGEVIQAPTSDQELLLGAIQSLTTGRRTAIGSGLLTAIDAISEIDKNVARSVTSTTPQVEPAPVPKGDYAPDIVVLLTDGVSNAGPTPVEAAQQAADRGVRVYTIGFGTANGGALSATCAPQFVGREPQFGGGGFGGGGGGGGAQGGVGRRGIDETTLQQVADMTGGKYYSAESSGELQSVFDQLPTNLITKHEVEELSALFLALAVLSAGGAVLLGHLWRPLP